MEYQWLARYVQIVNWLFRYKERVRRLGFPAKNPLTATEIPRLPACVVRGAAGAVIENVLTSLAHFEMKRDKVCQKRMEDVRGVRDHEVGHDN
jgi:integrase